MLALVGVISGLACAAPSTGGLASRPVRPSEGSQAVDISRQGCATDGLINASPLRSTDPEIRALLADGCRHSPTFRRLTHEIARTDGIVYVDAGRCPNPGFRGCLLHRIRHTEKARYLRIVLRMDAPRAKLAATLGHELQHAVEVLTQPWIRSETDVLQFYRTFAEGAFGTSRLGSPFRSYETAAAIDAAAAILLELAGPVAVASDAEDDR